MFYKDILTEAKLDVRNVFDFLHLYYYNNLPNQEKESQEDSFSYTNITEKNMMIGTWPRYPSDQFTFSIANITKHRTIRYLGLELNSNKVFDVDVVLEDSKRNFLNSFM